MLMLQEARAYAVSTMNARKLKCYQHNLHNKMTECCHCH